MTNWPPFKSFMAVDSDLSLRSLLIAYGAWITAHDSLPTVLWVHPEEVGYAEQVLNKSGLRLVVLHSPEWPDTDAWSVGTRRDYGFGSVGA